MSKAPPQSCSAEPDVAKAVTIVSDPVGSLSPYALPGSVVEYTIDVTNDGQRLDDGTVSITDALPEEIKLIVSGGSAFELVDGSTASDLSLNWGGPSNASDGVLFSADGSNFDYTPNVDADGADAAITHVRFDLDGAMRQRIDTSPDPSFTIRFRAIVK
ncbi:MAG: hypothetical protein ACX94D_03620 [Henriciella sp.]